MGELWASKFNGFWPAVPLQLLVTIPGLQNANLNYFDQRTCMQVDRDFTGTTGDDDHIGALRPEDYGLHINEAGQLVRKSATSYSKGRHEGIF